MLSWWRWSGQWRSHRPFLVASKSMRAQRAKEFTGHILLTTYTLKVMALFWAELDASLHGKWVTKWPFTMAQRWLCVAVGPCPLEIAGPSWCPVGTQPFWKVGQRSENSHPIPFAKAATRFFWPKWEAYGGHWTLGALRCSSCVSQARALISSPPDMTLAGGRSLACSGHIPGAVQGSGKIRFNYNLFPPLLHSHFLT